jgi:hypothetical protein
MLASGGFKQLERVTNTLSTAVEDYLGSYIPLGDGFVS